MSDVRSTAKMVPAVLPQATVLSVLCLRIIDEKKQAVMSNIWQKVSGIMEEERTENGRMLEEVQSLSLKSLTLLSKKRMEQDRVRRLCRTAIKLRVLSFRIIRKIFDLKKVGGR